MRESELAQLLLTMASDQGVPTTAAAEQIAALTLPAWVDAARMRSALVEAVERQMRTQMEAELDALRQRMLQAAPVARPSVATQSPGADMLPRSTPPPDSVPAPAATQIPEAGMPPVPPPALVREADLPPNSLPPDSTMVWTTQHGRPPEEQ